MALKSFLFFRVDLSRIVHCTYLFIKSPWKQRNILSYLLMELLLIITGLDRLTAIAHNPKRRWRNIRLRPFSLIENTSFPRSIVAS